MNRSINLSKQIKLTIIFLLLFVKSFSQTSEIDSIINIIDFRRDSVRAIFDWVATEIEYDSQSLLLVDETNIMLYNSPTKSIIREVISRRKGVCYHYAELFNALLTRLGYQSYVIDGYVMQEDIINNKYAHAWNAVKVKDKWFLYDPTWSAGYVRNFIFKKRYDEKWYKVSPESFLHTHIPFDPIWQFINPPLSHYQIRDNDFTIKGTVNFNFQDSIFARLKYTKREECWTSLQRVKEMGLTNNLIEKYAKNLMINYDLATIQSARDSLRMAINYYNKYIYSRNNRFKKPVWTDNMIRSNLGDIKMKIDASNILLDSVNSSDLRLAQYKSETKKQILSLKESVDSETIFINKYLSIWSRLRSAYKF
ncbi:transglutaminase domain-containing protein [Dyadobacter frigoris]|uniref:Transglutaminase-like domain-containing protein n=1 Tax=Dyadobacter frigoris TaxID=2576211 RepID=A0A4U6CW75_9BACT|nr:transglutaminase domain-containing protein [Dyadobacter frigoris]TKT88546.1 hypothetical protein FDK13_26715 [Dyadobacter frigoris]GLU54594.1 hypothetical protein Dfri01_40550 [Dyadobacter frigoris]